MLFLVATGVTVILLTVGIHAVGTTSLLRFLVQRYSLSDGQFQARKRLAILLATVFVLFALHFIEILLWAAVYMWVAPAELPSAEAAIYFSAVTFTTLGYGDITLSSGWRLLSGFEAIDGILLLGWTTALLFAVLQRSWSSSHDPARKRKGREHE